ncbi:hypothetical protein [Vibrio metschnikovii]|uniref:RiboL-PSP-HEPN domain-containing protein n=1 Tax=Vibrio metschnikovii TaxID=28172 RepID=A0A9X0RCD1_VIBME|nr:hypothetical protein [Vibrio metschnikovii]MBC5853452.1 hypothetical protein [Vibrio metschnikovii]
MEKRDRVSEILRKKDVSGDYGNSLEQIYSRLDSLGDLEVAFLTLKDHDGVNNLLEKEGIWDSYSIMLEGAKYVPVGLVACLESYFRVQVARVIDSHEFYKNRASKLQVKLDLQTAIDLEVNKLTIGEFISHLVKLNNIDDINKTMTTIMEDDFLKNVGIWREKLDYQVDMFNTPPNEKFGYMLASLKRIFEQRNLICHESYFDSEIIEQLMNTKDVVEFIRAVNSFIDSHIASTNKLAEL